MRAKDLAKLVRRALNNVGVGIAYAPELKRFANTLVADLEAFGKRQRRKRRKVDRIDHAAAFLDAGDAGD